MSNKISIEITGELIDHLSKFGEIDTDRLDIAKLERLIYEAVQIGALIHSYNASTQRFNDEVAEILELPYAELLRTIKREYGPIPDDAVPTDPLKRKRIQRKRTDIAVAVSKTSRKPSLADIFKDRKLNKRTV